MENIRYFEDPKAGYLFAYERASEFFVSFFEDTKEWKAFNVTFMQVMRDYELREISSDEAARRTNGRLPEAEYEEYVNMLCRNLSGI